MYSKINSHRIHQKVIAIGNLICNCNNICKIQSKEPIFKMTERLLESLLNLTNLVAEDINSFSSIMNMLSQVLYEGSGTNKPLYYQGESPILSKAEYEFISRLQILRNKWLMHNTDRKGEDATASDWQKISEALKYFGLNNIPYTKIHFKQLHLSLLDKAEGFLLLLASKL